MQLVKLFCLLYSITVLAPTMGYFVNSSKYRRCRGSGHSNLIPTIASTRTSQPNGYHNRNSNPQNLVKIYFSPLQSSIKIIYMNARSVNNKADVVAEYIIDEDADIYIITETWLRNFDDERIITAI